MTDLQQRAKARLRKLQRARRDPRFRRAVGRLVAAKLLRTNIATVEPFAEPVPLGEMLWAGKVEPRILELLPAIVLKRPGLLEEPLELPDDLTEVVRAIRHRRDHPSFRGVPPAKYLPWVERIGRRGKSPSMLKSFRFQAEDVDRIRRLKASLPARSETEVVRLALRTLEQLTQDEASTRLV